MSGPRPFETSESLERCPVCSHRTLRPAFAPDVMRCGDCAVYFRNPRPTQEEIERSYNAGENYAQWSASDQDARRALWLRRLRAIPARPPGELLDIGTGDGFFLGLARAAGFGVTGTDASAAGVEIARRAGHRILHGQLMALDLPAAHFDVVTIWHVLEHVPDPGAVLGRIFALLKPGGVLALAVPNEENSLFRWRIGWRKTPPFRPFEWGHEIHLTHFQPHTLRSALRRAGFEVLRFGVDDIYADRSPANLFKLYAQKTVSAWTGWHFSMAMYCVCRKPRG